MHNNFIYGGVLQQSAIFFFSPLLQFQLLKRAVERIFMAVLRFSDVTIRVRRIHFRGLQKTSYTAWEDDIVLSHLPFALDDTREFFC